MCISVMKFYLCYHVLDWRVKIGPASQTYITFNIGFNGSVILEYLNNFGSLSQKSERCREDTCSIYVLFCCVGCCRFWVALVLLLLWFQFYFLGWFLLLFCFVVRLLVFWCGWPVQLQSGWRKFLLRWQSRQSMYINSIYRAWVKWITVNSRP